MKLAVGPFEKIVAGTKTIESRLYDEKRRTISLGDEVEFRQDASRTVTKRVAAIHLYPTFAEMMRDIPPSRFGWSVSDEAIEEIGKFYSAEDQAAHGVIGIQLA